MEVANLLTDRERRLWRRFERRLCVIQMGRGAYSYTHEKRFDQDKARVIINALRDRYGSHIETAIAPNAVEDQVQEILANAGATDPVTMHPGDVESRNDFTGETIGLVLGCIDPGDDYVLDILAELGYDATPERKDEDCNNCHRKGCPSCDGSGQERAFGRGFVGPNADDAADILASVRENQVAQSIGRYARKADDPDDWATVFTYTNALPDGLADFRGPKVWTYSSDQRAITQYISERSEATAKEIADWITDESESVDSCSKEHVRQTMWKHIKHGNVRVDKGKGYYGADLYRWVAREETVSERGSMTFQLKEISYSGTPSQEVTAPPAHTDPVS